MSEERFKVQEKKPVFHMSVCKSRLCRLGSDGVEIHYFMIKDGKQIGSNSYSFHENPKLAANYISYYANLGGVELENGLCKQKEGNKKKKIKFHI